MIPFWIIFNISKPKTVKEDQIIEYLMSKDYLWNYFELCKQIAGFVFPLSTIIYIDP